MICPNCGKKVKDNYCMCCGYMINGNFIHKVYSNDVSDLELYLGGNYQKVIRNETFF